ncbi:hypothetical protein DHX103_14455 [Planococcus sp. X10-3]|uniref:hypothetical protein n=1 Tax=Planococcus sp. X10-3 TaxID=3061240 RepID=UPI003BAFF6E6
MRVEWMGDTALIKELIRKSQTDFDRVGAKSLLELRNRAVKSKNPAQGGTPVDSSELRMSATVNGDSMGYIKDYAPHVEYGHRLVNGGFVPGQYFLRTNVNIQKPIFREDLITKMRE